MSDYVPNSGVAEWIALRRAHEGGVANLVGQWFDSGRPVPGYVADALEGLTSGGLLVLADADPDCGELRRVIVTDTGSAHYVTLRQIHNPRATVTASTPHRWALSPPDQRSHLLAQRATDQVGVLVAVCGRRMPWSRGTSAQPTGRQCPTCQALAQVPNPQRHTSPDPGRSPAETAPGGRLDTTAPVRLTADADQNDRPSPTMRQAGLPIPVPQFPTKTRLAAGRATPPRPQLLAASRIPTILAGGPRSGTCGGRAALTTAACTYSNRPAPSLPGTTPKRCADAPLPMKASPLPTARRERCA
ncbi:MAG: hypothetical protein ACT4NP_11910 [Pseudonocardiales bacterium]